MKSHTARTSVYIEHTKYTVDPIRFAGYAVHFMEYSVCATKYTAHTGAYTVSAVNSPCSDLSRLRHFGEVEYMHLFLVMSDAFSNFITDVVYWPIQQIFLTRHLNTDNSPHVLATENRNFHAIILSVVLLYYSLHTKCNGWSLDRVCDKSDTGCNYASNIFASV